MSILLLFGSSFPSSSSFYLVIPLFGIFVRGSLLIGIVGAAALLLINSTINFIEENRPAAAIGGLLCSNNGGNIFVHVFSTLYVRLIVWRFF